jgi:protein-L-isoaspartate(D-aspartate) O-methyltransferase
MVDSQIRARGIRDERVNQAMARVPRHLFVPDRLQAEAYDDSALALWEGQTISQPYIVAYMTAALEAEPGARILEVGTGSGYQAAVLAEMGATVYTIEVRAELAERARGVLDRLGYRTVHVRCGDGSAGWPEAAPFDGILVTAAPDRIPHALTEQLAPGAHLVIPVGTEVQRLHVVTRAADGLDDRPVLNVRFVPFLWPDSQA